MESAVCKIKRGKYYFLQKSIIHRPHVRTHLLHSAPLQAQRIYLVLQLPVLLQKVPSVARGAQQVVLLAAQLSQQTLLVQAARAVHGGRISSLALSYKVVTSNSLVISDRAVRAAVSFCAAFNTINLHHFKLAPFETSADRDSAG